MRVRVRVKARVRVRVRIGISRMGVKQERNSLHKLEY
jgi:hypothetical protein